MKLRALILLFAMFWAPATGDLRPTEFPRARVQVRVFCRRWRTRKDRIMKLRHALLTVLLLAASAAGWEADLADSTCRITLDFAGKQSVGSGCVYAVDAQYVRILTNAHVVDFAQTVTCEFWSSGHKSRRFTGQVVARRKDAEIDAAVVVIPTTAFGARTPRAIPLDWSTLIQVGETLYSCGSANGSWATAWKGHAIRIEGSKLDFRPPPADGRSGSAIVRGQGDEARIVALLYARSLDGRDGFARTIKAITQRLTQYCPDCPDENYPTDNRQFQLFGRQYAVPDADSSNNPYPTIPLGMTPMSPMSPSATLPGPTVTAMEFQTLTARLDVLEADVAVGRDLVARFGLLEADTDAVEAMAATLSADVAKAQKTAEAAVAMVDDIDTHGDPAAVEALAATVDEVVEAIDEKQKDTDGWISLLLGMAGTALAGLIPGGGLALWALKRSGASEKAKDRVEDLATGALDRIERRLDGLTDRLPSAVNDLADSALKKTLAALKKQL